MIFPQLLAVAIAAVSPPPGIERHILQTVVPTDEQQVVQGTVNFPIGGVASRHLHHGTELIYVVSGDVEFYLGSGTPVTLHPGETLMVPREVPHGGHNIGKPATVLSTWIVDKGAPLAEPVP
jgi:quercetin dioxygenase-like cupin family protein